MDVLDIFRAEAAAQRGRVAQIAKATGINDKTLYNLLYHPTRDPRGSTKDKLREFYEREGRAA